MLIFSMMYEIVLAYEKYSYYENTKTYEDKM